MPVPPIALDRVPATAAELLKSTVPKVGTLLDITRTWPLVPEADLMVPEPLPSSTAFDVMLDTPRPPLLMPNTPEIELVGRVGISATTSEVPY